MKTSSLSNYEVPTIEEIEKSVQQEQEAILWLGYNDIQNHKPLEVPACSRSDSSEITKKKVEQQPYTPSLR